MFITLLIAGTAYSETNFLANCLKKSGRATPDVRRQDDIEPVTIPMYGKGTVTILLEASFYFRWKREVADSTADKTANSAQDKVRPVQTACALIATSMTLAVFGSGRGCSSLSRKLSNSHNISAALSYHNAKQFPFSTRLAVNKKGGTYAMPPVLRNWCTTSYYFCQENLFTGMIFTHLSIFSRQILSHLSLIKPQSDTPVWS